METGLFFLVFTLLITGWEVVINGEFIEDGLNVALYIGTIATLIDIFTRQLRYKLLRKRG